MSDPVAAAEKRHAGTTWTTRTLLRWMADHFQTRGVESPRLVAEMLLAHVLGCDRLRLYMEVDRPATASERATLRTLVARAARFEPVQYLVGWTGFFGQEILVGPSTMIPQPCTEDLVAVVLGLVGSPSDGSDVAEDGRPAGPRILDIGTGTGCIAVTLARQIPHARILATDVVPAALALAGANAERLNVAERIEFVEGSLFAPLRDRVDEVRFDVICSNPPYIPDSEWDGGQVDRGVREHVPASALRGGPDGLAVIRPLIAEAGAWLAPGGLLAIEIAHVHRDAAIGLVEQTPDLVRPEVRRDSDGFWRILTAQRR